MRDISSCLICLSTIQALNYLQVASVAFHIEINYMECVAFPKACQDSATR